MASRLDMADVNPVNPEISQDPHGRPADFVRALSKAAFMTGARAMDCFTLVMNAEQQIHQI